MVKKKIGLTQQEVDAKNKAVKKAMSESYQKFVDKATEIGIIGQDGLLDDNYKEMDFSKKK